MLSYIISEADFRSNFKIIDSITAVKNENKKSKKKSAEREKSPEPVESESSESESKPSTTSIEPSQFRKRKLFERKIRQALHRYKIRSKL